MPRRAVNIGKIGEEDRIFRQELSQYGAAHADNALRIIDNLEQFVELNRLTLVGERDEFILEAFLVHVGRQTHASTLATVAATIEAFRIRPSTLGAARQLVMHRDFMKSIQRRGVAEPPIRVKPAVPLEVLMALVEPRPGDSRRTCHLRAFWFLLVATGARPHTMFEASRWSVDEGDGVMVGWGPRKGGRHGFRSMTKYAYRFSAPPPLATQTLLASIGPGGWDMPEARQVASLLCSFIKRELRQGALSFTSTAPRDRMSGVLLGEVAAGRLSSSEYQWMMDHTEDRGRQHYAPAT